MGMMHFGKKEQVDQITGTTPVQLHSYVQPIVTHVQDHTIENMLNNRIFELEHKLNLEEKIVEKEIIKYIEKPVDREVIKYVDRIVEKEVMVPTEVIKYVQVPVEKIVDKEVIKHIQTVSFKVPNWAYVIMGIELLSIIILLVK